MFLLSGGVSKGETVREISLHPRILVLSPSSVELWDPYPRITDLGAETIDGPGPVNLPQFTFHVRKTKTHFSRMLIRQHLKSREEMEAEGATEIGVPTPSCAPKLPLARQITLNAASLGHSELGADLSTD